MNRHFAASAVRTRLFHANENLHGFVDAALETWDLEGRIIAVTTKIVSLAEGRIVERAEIDKRALVARECTKSFGIGSHGTEITLHQGLLIASAGIDESNSESGGYILYPKDPYASAYRLWHYLREKRAVKNLGVILTDSHTQPLRRGVTGFGLAHWGFRATRSLVGQPDLFNRPLKFTHVNVVDSLASAAVYVMGESDDACPIAVIEGGDVEFTETTTPEEIKIPPADDLYLSLFRDPP